jgi:N-glycosylase/DNA lyase
MVKSAEYRARKYEAKFDPTVVSSRFTAVKDMAVEQANARQSESASIEAAVRSILTGKGEPTWKFVAYHNASRQMGKKARSFGGDTLSNAITNIIDKWVSEGLDRVTLQEIANLFGVGLPSY